jgi:heterodisulfide reductase subunit A
MYALKDAYLIKEKTGGEVYEMYIDMRCFGEGYEEFYKGRSEQGIHFIRGKPSEVTDRAAIEEERGKLIVVTEDTLLGGILRVPVDMVILCTALEPRSDAEQVARLLNIGRRPDGFLQEKHLKLDPVATPTSGVFVVGCCQSPKDISDTVSQSLGGAAEALALIGKGRITLEAAVAMVNLDLCIGCGRCREVCEFHTLDIIKNEREMPVCQVNEVVCQGCGSCAVACPTGAMTIKHFTEDEILATVDALVEATC